MKLSQPTTLEDTRSDCYSIIVEISIFDYLELVNNIYKKKGGLKEQREPLKSSSAMRIRKQMVKDIKAGTILPPIVIGVIVKNEKFEEISKIDIEGLSTVIQEAEDGNLTIIDGMQRTTALYESIENGANKEQLVRIEFWISTELNNLIYRMLVLNTGQVPWNLRRQIETVFSSMINEISEKIPEIEIYTIDDPNRRTKGGQYHANDLIELYLVFGGRKEKVDTKERLADEFTRLDFIEATEKPNFSDIFYESLKRLVFIDIEVSKFMSSQKENRFLNGKDLFKSQPARVGLITAVARKIYGRPGIEKEESEIENSKNEVFKTLDSIIDKIKDFDNDQLGEFLAFDLLSEKLLVKTSRVGDFEREFFTKAFEILLEDGNSMTSMSVSWLAY